LIRGYLEMNEDWEMEKSQRRRGILEFKESYDMLSWGDIAECDLDELDDDDDTTNEEDDDDYLVKDDPANIRPNKSDMKYSASHAEESIHDKKEKKRMRIIKEEIDLPDHEIHIPKAAEAVQKRMKSEETTQSFMPSAQAPKVATLHQRSDATEPFARRRNCSIDRDEQKESIGDIAPNVLVEHKSENHCISKTGGLLPVDDHDCQMDRDGKLIRDNVVVPGGAAKQAATRVLDGKVTQVSGVPHAQSDARTMAETLAVVTDPVNGGNTELSQAVKNLMLAMAQLVEVAERPMVAAAPNGRSRGVRQSELLLHTSRRMAEMAVEVASTEPKIGDDL